MPPDPANPQPASFPQALEERLRLKLRQWTGRTLLWGALVGMLAAATGWGKIVLVFWIGYSVLSLAGILFGLHVAKRLKANAAAPGQPFPPSARDDDVIDIEAEVVDSSPDDNRPG